MPFDVPYEQSVSDKHAMSPLFPPELTAAEHFSRSDVMNVLGTFSRHGFFLDEREWPSVEHYYQAMVIRCIHERVAARRAAAGASGVTPQPDSRVEDVR